MIKYQASTRRTRVRTIGLLLAATLAIAACGTATAAQTSAVGDGRDQSAHLRQLNEALYPQDNLWVDQICDGIAECTTLPGSRPALYPDTITTDVAAASRSRLEQLDEALYPDTSDITPHSNLTPR